MGEERDLIERTREALLARTAQVGGERRRRAIAQLALPEGQVWGVHGFEAHGQVHWRGRAVNLAGGSSEAMAQAIVELVVAGMSGDDVARDLLASTGGVVEVARSGMYNVAFGAGELLGTGVICADPSLPVAVVRTWIDLFEEQARRGGVVAESVEIEGRLVEAAQTDTVVVLTDGTGTLGEGVKTKERWPVESHGDGTGIDAVAEDLAATLGGKLVSVAVLGRRHIDVAEYDVVIALDGGFEAVIPVSLGAGGTGCMGVEPTHVTSERDLRAREILAGALTAGVLENRVSVDEVIEGFEKLGANRFEAGVVARHRESGLCVLLRRS